MRALRRLLQLIVLVVIIAAVYEWWRRQQAAGGGQSDAAFTPVTPTAKNKPTWVAPVDGKCPPGYPVKVNVDSGIFHVPGGRSYERTHPDRCYSDAAAAEADCYRQAKL